MIANHQNKSSREFVTTNLRLPKDRLQELKLKALNEGASMAELVRQAIDVFLGYKKNGGKNKGIWQNPFSGIIDLGQDDITDGSVNHDYYLYGMPKKSKK